MSDTALQVHDPDKSLTIRPIRITDAKMEAEFFRHLSPRSKHYRFLGGVRELDAQLLKGFSEVDRHHSMAFVATVNDDGHETEIGVSRYAGNANSDCREMAVTVTDEWQQKGIGTLLTQKLIDFAKAHGVKNLYSIDLSDNIAMRELAADLGMTARRDPDDAHQVIYSLAL